MNLALWIVQAVLALVFFAVGGMKLILPIDTLVANGGTYAAHLPPGVVRFIGVAEVAGALGLIVPAALRIRPGLTPLAAAGLTVVMILAVVTHLGLGEPHALALPGVLAVLTGFVAWGRARRALIAPRTMPLPATV